ncbi:MAG TPA: peptide ABC transporter substrate-binding protein [Chloroflexota bacterium]|nr:peptide ABC transporter substrate-binding protein [Chloroflexota bacterium]
MKWPREALFVLVLLLAGCAPTSGTRTPVQNQPGQVTGPKVLTVAVNEDPKNFWDGVNGGGGGGSRELSHFVNQYLAAIGPDGTPTPRLLAEFPSTDAGTWTVSPDGRMEVTYRLRPGVTWHDGTPFTADDMVFSWEVDRDPAIPNGNQSAVKLIEQMVATDERTAVATWSQTYPFADRLEHREFYPLPAHLLERSYRESKDSFLAQPYFSDEYVGLGPFKVKSWEHGSSLDLDANESFFLGRPKLDRIHVLFIPDPNTAVASMRAGAINVFLPTGGPDWDQLQPLDQEWKATGKGTVVAETIRWKFAEPQKSRLADPGDLADPRVRQALLLGINRQEMASSLLGEMGNVADSWEHPKFAVYAQLKDSITQYPFDPKRATAQFAEAGWTPGPDGTLQKNGVPFHTVITYEQNQEKEATIIRQDLKAVGVDGDLEVISNLVLRDAELRASYTGIGIAQNPMGALSAVRRFASDQIPTAANRFAGTNRGSFTNADWDDIGKRLRTALLDSQRIDLERDLLTVFSAQLPALPLIYEIQAVPVAGFKGLIPITGVPHTGNIMHTTNAHEWELIQ